MRKFYMVLISFIMVLAISAQAGNIQIVKLDDSDVLTEDQVDIALNNQPVNCIVVKQNDNLYIDIDFFTDYFKIPPEQINNYTAYEGTVKVSGKDITCVPLFSVLTSIGVRYTYNPVFNKDIIRIRTDRDFSVNPNYVYKPSSDSSQGNLPVQDYTVSASSSVDYDYYYNQDTYYPPGYIPGYYFGSYGFIGNRVGPVQPIIHNPPLMPLHGGGGFHGGGGRR